MCIKCVKTARPERDNCCLDQGSFLVNFLNCAACGKKSFITTKNLVEEEEDDDEDSSSEHTITYDHHCTSCDHLIAEHFYSYKSDDQTQESLMECILCGRGTNVVRIAKMINDIKMSRAVSLEKPRKDAVIKSASEIPQDISSRLQSTVQRHTTDLEGDDEWE